MYIPNLIGYGRFILLWISTAFAFSKDRWILYPVLYGTAYILDALDGHAARTFNQCSRYGAALDMICDRASNAVMYMVLSAMFPEYDWVFYACFILDFGSHWYQFQT